MWLLDICFSFSFLRFCVVTAMGRHVVLGVCELYFWRDFAGSLRYRSCEDHRVKAMRQHGGLYELLFLSSLCTYCLSATLYLHIQTRHSRNIPPNHFLGLTHLLKKHRISDNPRRILHLSARLI